MLPKPTEKKLANAYSDASPLVDIRFLATDTDLVAYSNIRKVLIFDTTSIAPKSTRTSQGVQVLKAKKGSLLTSIKTITESRIKTPRYYKTKTIPAVGCYLREEDMEDMQVKFDIIN